MMSERGVLRLSAMSTTVGLVLAAMPMSTSQTSPCRGFAAIEDIQNFLLHFARRQHVGPGFFLTLARKEPQVMQDLAQHGLGLTLDFRKERFLRAHSLGINKRLSG